MKRSALNIVKKYFPNVTSVVDAKKDALIEVTAKDCKRASSKEPDSCAMAKAFKRTHDGAIISLHSAYLIDGKKATRYLVPQSVKRELVSFDRHHDFAPGAYKLNYVSQSNTMEYRDRTGKERVRNTDGKTNAVPRKKYHKTAGIRSL